MQPTTAANRRGLITQIALLLLWPFGALVSAVTHFRKPWAKVIFWLFCVYFGYVFVYAEPFGVGGADSARYAEQLVQLNHSPVSLDALVATFYTPGSNAVDIYQGLVTWLVSLVTDDPRLLFMLFAAVFGYFYTQNLWLIFDTINKKVGWVLLVFMLALALVNPIWNINGARMWTAAQIFLYGNLLYFLKGDRKGLAWSAASILVHFAFLFPVAALFSWLFLPMEANLYFAFYVATAFVHEINLHAVRQSLSFMPEVFQPKVQTYTAESYAEALRQASQQLSWHAVWAPVAGRAVTYAWVIAAFIRRKRWAGEMPGFCRLFLFALLFGGLANLASLIPSGGRFLTVANGLFYALFVAILGQQQVRLQLRPVELLCLPFMAFAIIFQLRMGLDYIGFLVLIGNPFLAIANSPQTPLIHYLKELFR
jgi:hypothetical protein